MPTPSVVAELRDDQIATLENIPTGGNVAANDDLPANAPTIGLLLVVTREPVNGRVQLDPTNGDFGYTPNQGFAGTDSFEYSLVQVDQSLNPIATIATATVGIQIEQPALIADSLTALPGVIAGGNVAANDTLPANAASRGLLLQVTSEPRNGTVQLNPVTGDFGYTSNADFAGVDFFEYGLVQVDQSQNVIRIITTTTVQVVVEQPVLNADSLTALPGVIAGGNVAANDIIPVDAVSRGLLLQVINGPANGTVQLDPTNGDFGYTSNPEFGGRDTFEYGLVQVDEDQNLLGVVATALVEIIVEQPVLVADSLSAVSGVIAGGNVAANDTLPADAVSRGLLLQVISEPANGIVQLDPTNGDFGYTSNAGFAGRDTFEYGLVQVNQNQEFIALLASTTVTIDVSGVSLADDQLSTASGLTEVGNVAANDDLPANAAQLGLLLEIAREPDFGTVELNPVTGEYVYRSNNDYFGQDEFFYDLVQVDQNRNTLGIVAQARVQISIQAPVVFFKDHNFSGKSLSSASANIPWLGNTAIGNDKISSIFIEPGYSVLACEHKDFHGHCKTYLGNISRMVSFNDRISSVRIEQLEPEVIVNNNRDDQWVRCAVEGEFCPVPFATTVRYGEKGRYVDRFIEGGVNCTNHEFVDVLKGVRKQCEYLIPAQFNEPAGILNSYQITGLAGVSTGDTITPANGYVLGANQGFIVTEQPANGEARVSPITGQYLYIPNDGFAGHDVFTYGLAQFDQLGQVVEVLAMENIEVKVQGLLFFQSESASFDNTVGTYELDANGKPRNIVGRLLRSNKADWGEVMGRFTEMPRVFLISNAGSRARATDKLSWNGGTSINVNGRGIPVGVVWTDKQFNSSRQNRVIYETRGIETRIRMEDRVDSNDGDFNDVVLRTNFIR